MASMKEHHKVLTDGEGKCSVPMWSGGMPNGFCDEVAFGKRPDAKVYRRWDGHIYRDDGKYCGLVPGLACAKHGGPTEKQG